MGRKALIVVGYTRVSSKGQATDGAGLDVQAERIRAWCAYQGLPGPTIHSDVLTGANANRPGFRAAVVSTLDARAAGDDAALIVYKIDRLGRSAADILDTLEILLDAGVRVVSLIDGVDTASGNGKALLRLLVTMLAGFATLERETMLTRTADGRAKAKADGRAYSKDPAYGWAKDSDTGQLVPNPAERAVIDLVRGFRAAGDSLRTIGRKLVLAGHRPRSGGNWTPDLIARLAHGPRVRRRQGGSTRVDDARARMRFGG